MSESNLEELLERQASLRSRIKEGVEELIEVITWDIPEFFLRESRKQFVEATELADDMDAEKVAALKNSIRERGETLAAEIRSKLEDDEFWLASDLEGEGKSLQQNESVWDTLQDIGRALGPLLEELGIGEVSVDDPIPYTTPSRFIRGKFAPGLIESYWSRLEQLRLLEEEIEKRSSELKREQLAKLWDAN